MLEHTREAEIATLKARVAELEAEAEDTYRDAYAEGQGDANGAAADLWQGVIAFLTARNVTIPSDEGDGTHTAQEVADALGEEVGDLDRTITRLEAEKAGLLAVLRIFLGHDERFQVAVGGNPIAVDRMLGAARSLLSKLEGGG